MTLPVPMRMVLDALDAEMSMADLAERADLHWRTTERALLSLGEAGLVEQVAGKPISPRQRHATRWATRWRKR